MSDKVLIIEDEPTLARLVSYNLSQEGYEAEVVGNGAQGLHQALHSDYAIIFLDLMLPGLSGFEVLQKLRENGVKTPVIILTAKTAEEEVVQGLKLGADDYITKPFGVAELLARTSAVLRRTRNEDSKPSKSEGGDKVITLGDLQIYPDKYEVFTNGQWITLRPKEFEVLLYLAERPGIVITRDDLMNVVWGFDYIGGQRTVDVHVSSLRKKLELNQQTVQIESIRGVGYKLIVSRSGRTGGK
ncbi:chemotaxis protein CheY [Cohnella kolymensis]|uniref:Chemotaxis protein CheY n=1 Tax=Cohnella kolymensis TaxID=1590652 RepID=A0ABR5A3B7_9BACL|nr:response regulator transcription factor [Cohnella kolymensis]KIL35549.1 chemotaxis protein CheY [Cohnella kolymensis]